jgi:hypothetical protein
MFCDDDGDPFCAPGCQHFRCLGLLFWGRADPNAFFRVASSLSELVWGCLVGKVESSLHHSLQRMIG